MLAEVDPPSHEYVRLSTQPRFLLHSEFAHWSGVFFADIQLAMHGVAEHRHEQICVWHNPAAMRVQPHGKSTWYVVPSGVRVWLPDDTVFGPWRLSRPERGQFVFLSQERVETILERPYDPRTLAAWCGQQRAAAHISAVIFALSADLAAGSPAGPVAGDSLIVALVRYLAGRDGRRRARPGGLSLMTRRRLLDYIDAHLAEPLSLSNLAAEAKLSLRHLGRAFHITTGEPPHRYVLRQRIERARKLIEVGELSLAEVAGQVGFADQSRLTHTFKRVVGITPAQYRALTHR